MELLPIGPVLFVDTAGVDDVGALGAQRIEKTRQAIARTDVGVLVAEAGVWSEFEEKLLAEFRSRGIPVLVALNKSDLAARLGGATCIRFEQERLPLCEACRDHRRRTWMSSAQSSWRLAPAEAAESPVRSARPGRPGRNGRAGDAHRQGSAQGPHQATAGAVHSRSARRRGLVRGGARTRDCESALDNLKTPPKLVVTDAQVFEQVARVTPDSVPLTAFSILLSRLKGDLVAQTRAAVAVDTLQARRQGAGRRILHASSHRRRYRPGQNSALAGASMSAASWNSRT